MTSFQHTRWADTDFAQDYLDNSAGFIPDRSRMLDVMVFFAGCSFSRDAEIRILDLGCGDGVLTARLLRAFPRLQAVLVDGSQSMLEAARKRFAGVHACSFANHSFQDLLSGRCPEGSFQLVVSSLAIHHLDAAGKEALYRWVLQKLSPGGRFVNIDVVLSRAPALESEYLELWREWIRTNASVEANPGLLETPDRYRSNSDNQPDTLPAQLNMLERAGFSEVDCYAKFGIFAAFGGKKPG